jgi:4-hydroxy-tetrahydrodipicolinate reductase
VKIAVAGAGGRMGRTVLEAAAADSDLEVIAAVDAAGSPAIGQLAGKISIGSDLATVAGADVVLDFTRPEATLALLKHAKAMVIGTTGFTEEDKDRIAQAAKRIPIVQAANFAVGVNTAYKLAETAARILGDDYDIEIVEAHHRHKVDAPSGTALQLGEIIAAAARKKDFVYGRKGIIGERQPQQIGFHSIRGGDIVGEHTVIFAGAGERVEVTVRSQSRLTYANGALRAAKWLKGRPPALYAMSDVLGL